MQRPLIISVVRDVVMYERCIAKNPYCVGCELRMVDNRVANEGIPKRYNQALEKFNYNEPRWIVFCHEDFQPREDITQAIERAIPDRIYGPIGGELLHVRRWLLGGFWPGRYRGSVLMSNKDGSDAVILGESVPFDTPANTLDCQCLIVHSSLIAKYQLRFDEHLTFDLYAEDFCLGAQLQYGIVTAILPFDCQHYSRGTVAPRFFDQKAYLDRKYPTAEAQGCVGYTIGGGRTWVRRLQKRLRYFLDEHAPWAVDLILKVACSSITYS